MPASAIFISYAREDLSAALKIAESLRQAGIVVWLDQDELRGGDAWDAKIKRQIRECSLFLPIISQQTQQRREGYFRLEWLLAEQRFQLIARGTPFLVPVAIDDVGEGRALVPESFLAVQWTRLPGGECPPSFPARLATLLSGGTEAPFRVAVKAAPAKAPDRKSPPIWPMATAAVVAGILSVLLLWKPWVRPAGSGPAAPVAKEFPHNPDLQHAWKLINSNGSLPGDFALAEDLVKGVMGERATDPEAVTVMANVEAAYLNRGFDTTAARFASAQHYGERAVELAPDNAYAYSALGLYFYRNDNPARAAELFDKAVALRPDEVSFYRYRDDSLFNDPATSTVAAIHAAEATSARFPDDALCHYDLARHYRDAGRIADFEAELDKTIRLEPIVNAVLWKARVALWVRGDATEMKRLIDSVPVHDRGFERWVIAVCIYSMAAGKPQLGADALNSLPEDWCNDFDYRGPKGLLLGILLDQEGKRDLARVAYADGLAVTNRQEGGNFYSDRTILESKVGCLYGLGRLDEARAAQKASDQLLARPYFFGFGNPWWFAPIPANLLLGNHDTAIQLIREAIAPRGQTDGRIVSNPEKGAVQRDGYPTDNRHILYEFLRVDPRMAPYRNDPQIKALLETDSDSKL